jgi:ankyrin repeat protein
MRKQIFFLLSSIVVCMPIFGMEQEQQKSGLLLLPSEVVYKATQYCDLQSIGRIKRVNKFLSVLDTVQMVCQSHGQDGHICVSPIIQELKREESYKKYSRILMHCAQYNKKMFEALYELHKKRNDVFLEKIYPKISLKTLTINDKALAYAGRYVDEARVQNAVAKQKNRALLNATREGNCELVRSLIENDTDVNATVKFKDNYSHRPTFSWPLVVASEMEHLEIARLLLDRGAKVDICGGASLRIACGKGNCALAQLLKERGAIIDYESLREAIKNRHFNLAQWLIDEGADVNACNFKGDTLLCQLYQDKSISDEGFLFFIKNKVYLDKCGDKSGKAIIHYACEKDDIKTVKILAENSADVNLEIRRFIYTPLYLACHYGGLELVQFLLDNNADVHVAKEKCLAFVLEKNYISKALLLIQSGASINDIDQKDLLRCFLLACKEGNAEVARILCNDGLKIDANELNEILYSACDRGRVEIVQLLLAKGGDCNANVYGRTAFSVMQQKPEFKEVVNSLPFFDRNVRSASNKVRSFFDENSEVICIMAGTVFVGVSLGLILVKIEERFFNGSFFDAVFPPQCSPEAIL